ncbi:MAG: alpha/beta fold hydrolase [Puniceicoccales bacterium]|nr:alpha/beta fold hydrolase [Puniceicoccales bacterium]
MSISAPIPAYLRTSYPFESRWLPLERGRMHYVDTGGGGPVVLLLHGNPTWSFLWRDLIRSLSLQGYRCIAPDHLGMGYSDKPDHFFRLADRIAHVESLLDVLGVSHCHLCVHDWGGAIGFGMALRQPERIGRLVVTNTAAFLPPPGARLPWRIAACRLPVLGELIVRGLNGFVLPATYMAVSRHLSRTVRAGYLAPYGSWGSRGAIARFVSDIPMEHDHPSHAMLEEMDATLGKLSAHPILLAWGGRDFCFNDAYFAEWARRFPNAILRYRPSAGHYVLEDAGDFLIPEIRDFLDA